MKKILVPVDFSAHSEVSCIYAREIARVTGADLVLFHSFFEQIYFSDGGFSTGFESGIMLTDEIILDFYKHKEKQLLEISSGLKKALSDETGKPVKISHIIESGDPEIQILNTVEKIKPDLVVMGSGGLGKKGFLAGSVCKRVMDHTEIPVMAIPDIRQFGGLSHILYMTDYDPSDIVALNNLMDLLIDFNITIHCIHLNINNKDKGSGTVMDQLSHDPALKDHKGKIRFEVLACSDPQKCLRTCIDQNGIQLIAFIPHKKNFFRIFSRQDLTKEDLFMTGLPILGIL